MREGDTGRETEPFTGGRFVLLELIGRGGSCEVYRATDRLVGRDVAIKVLRHESGAGEGARLFSEAAIGQDLTHPNIVRVHGLERTAGDASPVLVMEFVPGESARDRLQRVGKFGTLADVVAVLLPVARALEHAHGRGVIHRDVKPSNILLGDDGTVKLADFGVARADSVAGDLTRTGDVVGTLRYMAPEVLRGGAATARSDIYALGVVTRELYAGGGEPDGWKGLSGRRVIHLPKGTPPWFALFVRRCTEPDPADRYTSASEAVAELTACGAGQAPGKLVTALKRWAAWMIAVLASVIVATEFSDRCLVLVAPRVLPALGLAGSRLAHYTKLRFADGGDIAATMARLGELDLLAAFLSSGFTRLTPDSEDGSRLTCSAAAGGQVHVLRYLLDRGADPNGVCRGRPFRPSLLGVTMFHRRPQAAVLLLDRGASVEKTAGEGRGPLDLAMQFANTETLEALFGHDRLRSNPIVGGTLVLTTLAQMGRSEMLLSAYRRSGASLDARAPGGLTALHVAAAACDFAATRRLLAIGVPVGSRAATGEAALNVACVERDEKPVERVLAALLAAGADVNSANTQGVTLLMRAAASGNRRLVAALLGTDMLQIDRRDRGGHTALMYAALNYSVGSPIVSVLLRRGADITVRNDAGRSPIDIAQDRGDEQLVRLLRGQAARR